MASIAFRFSVLAASLGIGMVSFTTSATAQSTGSQTDGTSIRLSPAPPGRAVCNTVINGTLGQGSTAFPFTTGLQVGRLNRNTVTSTCAAPKMCDIFVPTGDRAFDAYELVNATGATACVTVDLEVLTQTGCNLQVNAYQGSYDPTSICSDYLADPGFSSGIPPNPLGPFAFEVPAGATFILPVHTVNPGEIGCEYILRVNGDICPDVPAMNAKWLAVLLVLLGGIGLFVLRRRLSSTSYLSTP